MLFMEYCQFCSEAMVKELASSSHSAKLGTFTSSDSW